MDEREKRERQADVFRKMGYRNIKWSEDGGLSVDALLPPDRSPATPEEARLGDKIIDWISSGASAWRNAQWGPPETRRIVRYRRSPNGIYQEVVLEDGHYSYGLYMPEGFVPPEGLGENRETGEE